MSIGICVFLVTSIDWDDKIVQDCLYQNKPHEK
jgi:hypothetical protein